MDIRIKETGAIETLEIIDPKTGVNFIADFIGNADGFGDGDGKIDYDGDDEIYTTDQDNFDWWQRVVAAHQTLTDRIDALSSKHGAEAVWSAMDELGSTDLELEPALFNSALDEAFGCDEA